MARLKRRYRFLLYFLAFILLTGLTAVLLQGYLNNQIKNLFVRELNKQLCTEVAVREVKFSLFRDFPYASVRFSDITLKEAIKAPKKGVLMKARLVSLRFGLLDLLKNKITVTNVLVRDAKVNLHVFSDGTDNFHFWKKSAGAPGKEFSIDLQKILLHKTLISYRNEPAGQDMRFLLKQSQMKGNFASDNYLMQVTGDLKIEQFSTGNLNYISDKQAKVDLSLKVAGKEGKYTLQKGELELNDLRLSTQGWVTEVNDAYSMDLQVVSSEATLAELISIVPSRYLKALEPYDFKGRAKVSVSLKGMLRENQTPAIKAEMTLNEGTIGRKHSDVALEEVHMVAVYSAQQDRKNELFAITGLNARLKSGTISGSMTMKGFTSTHLVASLKANLDLSDLGELLNSDTITSLHGQLSIDGKFEGRLADLNKPVKEDLVNCRLTGQAQVAKGELGLKGYKLPVNSIDGRVNFDNNNLLLKNLTFRYGKSDFALKGQVENLMGWILLKEHKLAVTGVIASSKIDWDELSGSSSGSGEYNFQLPGFLDIYRLHMNVKDFTFGKFAASNFSADLRMSNKVLTANNILMQSMKGVVSGQGSINAASPAHSLIQCKATFSKVNLRSLFYEFNNFGNTDLTSDNLDGSVTADVVYASTMFPNLEMDLSSVKAHADIRVDNGRLVNYEPMKGLSKFLRVEDLADIRFETLQNQVDIANQIIYIPDMKIRSSAIDLNLMGTHTFNNEIEYHFGIALADLIAAKFHRKNPGYNRQSEFGPVEDDGRGRTMIYVSMTGTVDNPEFSYDKRAVKEKLANEIRNQKSELKEAFRKEFGSFQGDSLRKAKNEKDKTTLKKQEEGKFVIEWDDDKK